MLPYIAAGTHQTPWPIGTTLTHARLAPCPPRVPCPAGENEENVAYALAKWPQMQLVPQRLLLGSPGLAGIAAPGCSRALAAAEASLLQRFDPGGPHDTIGFFISKFVKTASTLECM